MRRMRWRGRRRTLLVLALVAGAAVVTTPGVRDDARRLVCDHVDGWSAVALMERAAAWCGEGDRTASGAMAVDTAVGMISGLGRVIDGDTLDVGVTRVRLHGIDAPESEQWCRRGLQSWSCGSEAARALERHIGFAPVTCEERDVDRYGRMVAVCRLEGRDVNAWMVSEGWALAYRRYSMDYVEEEATARAAKRGVWRGELVAPWDWRRGVRLAGSAAPAPPSEAVCPIKGNISSGGERIYHVPGGEYYDDTVISAAKGERWFCTEVEARSAGWRRSRR